MLDQAIDIASEFVESQMPLINIEERVYDEETNTGHTEQRAILSREAGNAEGRNFIVLVNNFTASASEFVVSALKSHRSDVKTVGESTYGKARAQILSNTPESGLVKVTKAVFEPVTGPSYDLSGIVPDIAITPGQDALEVALEQIVGTLSKTGVQGRALQRIKALHQMLEARPFKPLNITFDTLISKQ